MNTKRTFTPTQLKNTGTILVVMGMIFCFSATRLTPSPINIATITALLMSVTGTAFLIAYYLKTDRKQLKSQLYLAAAMLVVVLAYYFAIARV